MVYITIKISFYNYKYLRLKTYLGRLYTSILFKYFSSP